MTKNHMAVDQYNNFFHNLGPHPRKALCARIGRQHVQKMYRDDPLTKEIRHVGYVIGGLWLLVYEVIPWDKPEPDKYSRHHPTPKEKEKEHACV